MTTLFERVDSILALDDVEQEMVDQLRLIVDREIAPRAEQYDQTEEFPWDNIRILNDLGMNGVFIPTQYGGMSLSYRCFLRLVAELTRGCSSTGNTWATTFNAVHPIVAFGTEEQKSRYLPRIAEGGLAAIAITEETGGSDVLAMRSTLTPGVGGDLVLNGEKTFITNGDVADVLVIFAKWSEIDGSREQLSAVIVDQGTPGLSVGKKETKLGYRASSTVSLRFDNCHVRRDNVLGKLGDGFKILLNMLNSSRPGISAQAVGIATAAFDETVRYVNERSQFGQRILEFQGTQFMIADMATTLATARAWLWRIGALIDDGEHQDYDIEASILKVATSDAAMSISTHAVQLHGGTGYMTGTKVERLFRDAKLTQIFEGANELHRTRIGRSFLQRSLE